MKRLKTNKILTITAVSAFILLASGCSEKMAHHSDAMHKKMTEAVEQASSKLDHEQLAASYDEEAAVLLNKARKHEKLASAYERTDNSKMALGADAARHCRSIAKKYREAAAENSALAKLHRQQADNSK